MSINNDIMHNSVKKSRANDLNQGDSKSISHSYNLIALIGLDHRTPFGGLQGQGYATLAAGSATKHS
jgi:hypothetical protein